MNHRHLQVYFFLAVFLAATALTYLVFEPFIPLLVFAGILAILMRPIHKWLEKYFRGQKGLAAISAVFLTLLIILLPLAFVFISLSMEAIQLVRYLRTEVSFSEIEYAVAAVMGEDFASQLVERASAGVRDVASYIQPVVSSLTSNVLAIFSNTAQVIFGLIIVLFSMYYLLKDGQKLKEHLYDLSPLDDEIDKALLNRIRDAVTAVAYGEFVVAIVKGIIGGIVFLILGLPSPVFWGTLIALSHLIPGVGTAIVTVPFAIYLFLSGQYVTGIIFTVIAVAIIGLVDNFLTPQLIGGRIHLHPLLILFSLLGGLFAFGPVGVFAGPIILAVFMALLDIYRKDFRTKVKRL